MALTLLLSMTTKVLLLACLLRIGVDSLPTGASGCAGNQPAVAGSHVSNVNTLAGVFEAVGMTLSVGGVVLPGILVNGDEEFSVGGEFETGVDYEVVVSASSVLPFKGVLVRVNRQDEGDATGSILPGAALQDAAACLAPVAGITHTDNSTKTMATGTIRFDQPGEVKIESTVVFANNDTISIFAYQMFGVRFDAADAMIDATTDAPVSAAVSTSAPVTSTQETSAPVQSTTTTGAPVNPVVTSAPVTAAPTVSPVTSAPVTAAPVTAAPVTAAPTVECAASSKGKSSKVSSDSSGKSGSKSSSSKSTSGKSGSSKIKSGKSGKGGCKSSKTGKGESKAKSAKTPKAGGSSSKLSKLSTSKSSSASKTTTRFIRYLN